MPLAAQSRLDPVPYSAPAKITSGTSVLLVAHRSFIDRQHFAARLKRGPTAFGARRHFVFDADVGERAAHHHFMVAASCAV